MNAHMPTYGRLEWFEGSWVLTDVPPHVAGKLKQIFARIPKTQTKTFTLQGTDENAADLRWFMQRYPLGMSPADAIRLERRAEQFVADKAQLERILLPDWKPEGALLGFRHGYAPYVGQRQAIEILHKRKSLLVGDTGGAGKTWVAMGAMVGSPYLPAAVIVDTHLATQWAERFIKPHTYLIPHVIDGTRPYSLPPANVYVFRYSNIAGWVDVAAEGVFKTVIFDEIQSGRTGEVTSKGAAMKVFADNAALRLGLSATPIFNYGSEVWNILRYIDEDVLGSWEDFVREWCTWNGTKWIVNEPDALGSYLRETGVFIRRVGQGRPVNRLTVSVDYDHEEAAKSEDLARILAQRVISGSFTARGQAARELDAFARQVTGVAKAKGVAGYVRILLQAGKRVLLAGWHREVYDIWLEELKDFNPVLYTGSETTKQKDRNRDKFVNGEAKVMLISLRSGAGLDGLQFVCDTVVIGELDWAPGIYDQLIWRVDRPGQPSDDITAIFCVSDSGSDPIVLSVNAIKRDQSRGILDPDAELPPVQADPSHIKMLAQHYLKGGAK
jgi:hypothetical protein